MARKHSRTQHAMQRSLFWDGYRDEWEYVEQMITCPVCNQYHRRSVVRNHYLTRLADGTAGFNCTWCGNWIDTPDLNTA